MYYCIIIYYELYNTIKKNLNQFYIFYLYLFIFIKYNNLILLPIQINGQFYQDEELLKSVLPL